MSNEIITRYSRNTCMRKCSTIPDPDHTWSGSVTGRAHFFLTFAIASNPVAPARAAN